MCSKYRGGAVVVYGRVSVYVGADGARWKGDGPLKGKCLSIPSPPPHDTITKEKVSEPVRILSVNRSSFVDETTINHYDYAFKSGPLPNCKEARDDGYIGK